jgi:hypothetical protein
MPKLPAIWSNNITKKLTAFTGSTKNQSAWGNESQTQTPYVYDSATMTYDSATVSYDYLVPKANQSNALNPTPWSAT